MTTRHSALEAFYGGPVGARHRESANATMIDSDDVLLLRPASGAVCLTDLHRSSVNDPGVVVVTIHRLAEPVSAEAVDLVSRMDALLRQAGSRAAILQTEPAANTFPALPVREGEHVLVRIGRFGDRSEHVRVL